MSIQFEMTRQRRLDYAKGTTAPLWPRPQGQRFDPQLPRFKVSLKETLNPRLLPGRFTAAHCCYTTSMNVKMYECTFCSSLLPLISVSSRCLSLRRSTGSPPRYVALILVLSGKEGSVFPDNQQICFFSIELEFFARASRRLAFSSSLVLKLRTFQSLLLAVIFSST